MTHSENHPQDDWNFVICKLDSDSTPQSSFRMHQCIIFKEKASGMMETGTKWELDTATELNGAKVLGMGTRPEPEPKSGLDFGCLGLVNLGS